jgi:spermidine/putrescine transport system permease protein
VIGAAMLAAALSLDEFVVTWFNVGNQQTVPVLVWGLMRRGIDPSINAIATILLGLLVCLVIASNIINRRKVK